MEQHQSTVRYNNFDMLRFMAAIMVITGHMAYIDGSNSVPVLFSQGVQTIGVKIFFLLGGYLISKSWLSDQNVFRYILKRIMRIFPALIVYVVFAAVIVGPLVSDLSVEEYYRNVGFLNYFRNIFLFPIYGLPGVFQNNPYIGAVNGSLWTLPVEVFMYIMVPIVLTVTGANHKKHFSKRLIAGTTIAVCAFQVLHLSLFPEWRYVAYGTNWAEAFSLIPFYFLGMLYCYLELHKKVNLEISVVMMTAYSCISINLSAAMNELLAYIIIPYFVFSFGLSKNPFFSKSFRKFEISYGMYLYGFFVQQIVVWLCIRNGRVLNSISYLGISIVLTCLIAAISYNFVEKPAQNLCKCILVKFNK